MGEEYQVHGFPVVVDNTRPDIDTASVVRRLDELELFGVDASSASRRHRLSVAYITLSVQRKSEDRTTEKNLFEPALDKKLAAAKKKFTEQVAPLNSDLHYGDGFLVVGLRSNTGPTHSAAN